MQKIKNFFKTEGIKLKQMNFTEKRQYIWEYYKLAFGIILIFLVIGYGLLDAWVLNPPKTDVLTIAWLADRELSENLTGIQDALIPALVANPEEETVSVFDFAPSGEMEYDMAKGQQFTALLGAGELDLFIVTGEQSVQEVALAEYVSTLDGVMGALLKQDPVLYERISPLLKNEEFTSVPNEYEQEIKTVSGVFAIPIQQSPYFAGRTYLSQDLYLCVSATTMPETYDNIIKAVRVFFSNE